MKDKQIAEHSKYVYEKLYAYQHACNGHFTGWSGLHPPEYYSEKDLTLMQALFYDGIVEGLKRAEKIIKGAK